MERPEAMDSGHIVLTGRDPDTILSSVEFVVQSAAHDRRQPIAKEYDVTNTSYRVLEADSGNGQIGSPVGWHRRGVTNASNVWADVMRVLILTQYYPPETAFKFADLARGLVERGHQVQVITGFPCYPYGRIYPGYRQKPYEEEHLAGALVTRLPQFPDHSRSILRRALYYFSFALSAATIGLWRARRADVILVYQSAFPIGLAAWVISRVKRTPYVLDVVDLWPESVAASGMMRNGLASGLIRRVVKFIYRGAHRINVITEGYRENLLSLGVPAEKLSLIHCWPAAGVFDPVPSDPQLARAEQFEGKFNIVYAGSMGPVQDLRTVIDASMYLRDRPEIQFVMIGDGVESAELAELARQRNASNVRFLGRKSPTDLQRLYPLADVLLVHLKSDPMSLISIPSKTFAYMAAGKPILMAVEGEASRLVEKHSCGVAVRPSNPPALADAVRELADRPPEQRDQMSRQARLAYQTEFCSDKQIDRFEALLGDVIGRPENSPIDGKPSLELGSVSH